MKTLTKFRVAKGWSKTELSKRSKVSQSFISDLEAGNKQPTLTTLNKLASALNIPVTDLINENATHNGTKQKTV